MEICMMAFGPKGWDPSSNLMKKIARIYKSKQDPFLKDSETFFEPEDDRLLPGTIEVDHVFAQGAEEVLVHVRNFTVTGNGPRKVMCSYCLTLRPYDNSILCLCNRYFCEACIDYRVCESAGEPLCSSCTAAVERHANPLMCMDDDEDETPQEEVIIDDNRSPSESS